MVKWRYQHWGFNHIQWRHQKVARTARCPKKWPRSWRRKHPSSNLCLCKVGPSLVNNEVIPPLKCLKSSWGYFTPRSGVNSDGPLLISLEFGLKVREQLSTWQFCDCDPFGVLIRDPFTGCWWPPNRKIKRTRIESPGTYSNLRMAYRGNMRQQIKAYLYDPWCWLWAVMMIGNYMGMTQPKGLWPWNGDQAGIQVRYGGTIHQMNIKDQTWRPQYRFLV